MLESYCAGELRLRVPDRTNLVKCSLPQDESNVNTMRNPPTGTLQVRCADYFGIEYRSETYGPQQHASSRKTGLRNESE